MSRHIPYRKSKVSESKSLVEKGSTDALRVDVDEIERTITILRDHHHMETKGAPKHLVSEMEKLSDWAKKLVGLETYNDFYRLIVKHFGDLSNIKPETIGAFCYGCTMATASSSRVPGKLDESDTTKGGLTDSKIKACSPTCIGSIPAPSMPKWVNCDSNVYLLYRDQKGNYRWKDMQTTSRDKNSYVFLFDDAPLGTPIDYTVITRKGLRKYSLYELKDGLYRHIKTDSFAQELRAPKRDEWGDHSGRSIQKEKKNRNMGIIAFIFAIVIILIIIAGVSVFYNSGRRRSGQQHRYIRD